LLEFISEVFEMPSVFRCGVVEIDAAGREWGSLPVSVPGMEGNEQVLLTSHTGNKGVGPGGKAPLFCPFVDTIGPGGFQVCIFEINGSPSTAKILVEWAVIRP
jgi:hypothetical protein